MKVKLVKTLDLWAMVFLGAVTGFITNDWLFVGRYPLLDLVIAIITSALILTIYKVRLR